jgi:hypothetical protein
VARSGNFGRLPRAVPSLSATLLAIAREQEQQRDQNIMEAWQKGGMFEGHKVTDAAVLSHWKHRTDGIAKDDPLYDTYKNAVTQLDYSIHESKMTAQYALIADPTAADDTKMANFFLNWGKRIPKDSEFYRVLQRDAGQYLRAAKAKAKVRVQKNEEKIYRSQLAAIEKRDEHAGQLSLQIVTMLAQRGSGGRGAILAETPLGNEGNIANTTNISDLQLPGVDQMMALLDTVNVETNGPTKYKGGHYVVGAEKSSANPEVLYHDETGRPMTGHDIIALLKSADPSFNGKFNLSYLHSVVAQQKQGLARRIALAKQTGHVGDMMQLQNQMAKVNEYGNQMQAWPVLETYADLKSQLDSAMSDDSLLPAAKAAAIDRIRQQIGNLAHDKRILADDHLRSALQGEAEGKAGTVTAAEDMEGTHANGFTNEQSDRTSQVMNVNAIRDLLAQQIELTRDPQSGYVMTQGDYVDDGKGGKTFRPSPGGRAVGAALSADINNLPSAGPAVTVMVPNGDGGGSTPMVVVPAPVMATARMADGTQMDSTNANPVCQFLRYKVNGKDVTLYGMTDKASGQTRWTNDPPWDTSKIKTQETNTGITLDLSAYSPQTDTTGPRGGDMGNGFVVINKHPAMNGKAASAGKLVYDPAQAALSTQPERQSAGYDPNTDSFSPTLVALRSVPDGQALLKQYAGDPNFAKIIDNDAHRAAGMTFDVNTGLWTGDAKQTTAYNGYHANAVTELDDAKNGIGVTNPAKRDNWLRDTTKTQTLGAADPSVVMVNGIPKQISALPLDALRQSGDERLKKMYDSVLPGGNLLKPADTRSEALGTIRMGNPLTVPTIKPGTIPAAPAPASAPAPVAPPPGSTTYNTGTYNAPPPTSYNNPSQPTSHDHDNHHVL